MKILSQYVAPVLVRFEKDLSVFTGSAGTVNDGSVEIPSGGPIGPGGYVSPERPVRPTNPTNATNKSTGIQDYNPFGE